MKNVRLSVFILILNVLIQSTSAVTILREGGWLETVYATWSPVSAAQKYQVYVSGNGLSNYKIDEPLIRSYGSYFRADVPGLAAGTYTLKIVPVIGGTEVPAEAATTGELTTRAHTREGFAFVSNNSRYIPGAYNEDGTPKTGAKIIYVTAKNANTVSCDIIGERGTAVSTTGLNNILSAKGKGYDKLPLIIRMIGLIKKENIDGIKNYVNFIGANTTARLLENVTIEGIGEDATAYGFGFFTKRSKGVEIRNFGIMMFGDDGVSMEADNFNIWVHNCDFFYGAPGSDADQVKGDGSIDMKYNTTNITISYNHFWDSGKSTFAGGAEESNPIYFSYHHNWFDHSDSRHPRTCWATVHFYNNYLDGNRTMCLLNTEASSVFMEANNFRNCPYPMMINMQGTNYEKWPSGTQNGGMTKAFNNKIDVFTKLLYQTDRPTDFDAYLVTTRDEKIPSTVVSRKGANTYSNFDTEATMYTYRADSPDSVPAIVMANAGRMNGGDLQWTFVNAVDDASTVIIPALKTAILNYTSALVAVQGIDGTTISNIKNRTTGKIRIVPNRGTDVFSICSDEPVIELRIYSIAGVLIEQIYAPSYTADLSRLPTGIYLIAVQTTNGHYLQKMEKYKN